MYWEVQGSEPRFNHKNFQKLPQYVVHQGIRARNHLMNLSQMTTARSVLYQIMCNIDTSKGAEPPELFELLPFPSEWVRRTQQLKVKMPRKVAISILRDYDTLDVSMKYALDPILKDIRMNADSQT